MKTRRRSAPDLEQMSLFTPKIASPPWSALSPAARGAVIDLLAELLAPRLLESTPPHPEDHDDER